jgi:hypothetical protein
MSKFKSWWAGVCESHRRHARLFHETQHRIIQDKIESDPVNMLERIRKLEEAKK